MTEPAFPTPAGFRVASAVSQHGEQRAPVRVAHPDPSLTVTLVPNEPVRSGWYELALRFPAEGTVDCIAQFVHRNGRVVWMRLPMLARNEFLAHLRLEGSLERLTLILSGSGRLTNQAHAGSSVSDGGSSWRPWLGVRVTSTGARASEFSHLP